MSLILCLLADTSTRHVQHISAPHIYGAVLEALDLQPNSSQAFLCIGSGTGYLCAIAAEIMGPKSLNFGK